MYKGKTDPKLLRKTEESSVSEMAKKKTIFNPAPTFNPPKSRQPKVVTQQEIPKGEREICRVISRSAGLISGCPGDQSMIFSDSCLIFLTWL